jgi:hypothetical protein
VFFYVFFFPKVTLLTHYFLKTTFIDSVEQHKLTIQFIILDLHRVLLNKWHDFLFICIFSQTCEFYIYRSYHVESWLVVDSPKFKKGKYFFFLCKKEKHKKWKVVLNFYYYCLFYFQTIFCTNYQPPPTLYCSLFQSPSKPIQINVHHAQEIAT